MPLLLPKMQTCRTLYTYPFHLLMTGLIWVNVISCNTPEEHLPLKMTELPELPEKIAPPTAQTRNSRAPVEFIIALTGEVRGEIEPCGCPTLPYGGFERREVLLNELRKNNTVFHLDAGEMLLKGFSTNNRNDKNERAALILELTKEVGLDAWNVGPADLSMLNPPFTQYDLAVSASFTESSGKHLFPPSKVLRRNDISLGIVGLSKAPTDPSFPYRYLPPEEALRVGLQTLKDKEVDLIVILSSISDDKLDALLDSPSIASVALSTHGSLLDDPHHAKKDPTRPLIVETPDRGRYVQNLYVRLTQPENYPLQTLLDEQIWRNHILEPDLGLLDTVGQGKNIAYAELVPLNKLYDANGLATVSGPIEEFKDLVRAKATEAAKAEPTGTEPGYATAATCARCHTQEFARWAYSKHTHAWESLILEGEADNPECIACHSTAYGEPSGFGELTESNILRYKSVQCEACHGPLRGHPKDTNIKPKPVTEEQCLGCHDEANSPDFDYESYLHLASCQPMVKAAEAE